MDYPSAKEFLFGLKGKGSKYGIDRMRVFAGKLGHPERKLRVIHVAGTNGKGSVSAMCEAMLRAAGYRTGLYTSPHLVRVGERIQVDRTILTEEEIVAYTLELKAAAAGIAAVESEDHPTFFEFMTAMALLHFVRSGVDAAILEVGLGGRLDATNIVDPEVSAITSIGLDHCQQLGDTLAAIAREKAGILKSGRPAVLGVMPPEAKEAILAVAKDRGVRVATVEDRFGTRPEDWPETVLAGDHQRANAATAKLVMETIRDKLPVPEEAVRKGLATVVWAGRWQRRTVGGRQLVFEAAHNPQGAEALERQLAKLAGTLPRPPILVAGALGDARAQALLGVAARHAREIVLCEPNQSRATPIAALKSCIPADYRGKVRPGRVEELFSPGRCLLGEVGDTIIVTGSIYLIGEVLERLEAMPAGEGRLQD